MPIIEPRADDHRVTGTEYLERLRFHARWWTGATWSTRFEHAPITTPHNVRWRLAQ